MYEIPKTVDLLRFRLNKEAGSEKCYNEFFANDSRNYKQKYVPRHIR